MRIGHGASASVALKLAVCALLGACGPIELPGHRMEMCRNRITQCLSRLFSMLANDANWLVRDRALHQLQRFASVTPSADIIPCISEPIRQPFVAFVQRMLQCQQQLRSTDRLADSGDRVRFECLGQRVRASASAPLDAVPTGGAPGRDALPAQKRLRTPDLALDACMPAQKRWQIAATQLRACADALGTVAMRDFEDALLAPLYARLIEVQGILSDLLKPQQHADSA